MKRKRPFHFSDLIVLFGILLFSGFLRFYKFSDWTIFGMDQEYQALIVASILTGRHIPLIGVNISDTGLYLGPFFSYFSAFLSIFSGGDPLGGAVFSALLGITVCFFLFVIGNAWFSQRIGLLAALFYGVSFLAVYYDRQYWNPTFIPLLSLAAGCVLVRMYEGRRYAHVFLAAILGLSLHIHASLFIFLPLAFIVFFRFRNRFSLPSIFLAILVFLVFLTPQIAFDFRHNFENSRALVRLFRGQTDRDTSSFLTRTTVFLSSFGRYVFVPGRPDLFVESGKCRTLAHLRHENIPLGIAVLSIVFLVFFSRSLRTRPNAGGQSVTTWFFFALITGGFATVGLYPGELIEYYFLYFFPWFALMGAYSFDALFDVRYGSIVSWVLLSLFVIGNTQTLLTARSSYSYKEKQEVARYVAHVIGADSYVLEAIGGCARFGGYRYLFSHTIGRAPYHSYMDSYFSWLYPETGKQSDAQWIILLSMIDEREPQEDILSWQREVDDFLHTHSLFDQQQFGEIRVFIFRPNPGNV